LETRIAVEIGHCHDDVRARRQGGALGGG